MPMRTAISIGLRTVPPVNRQSGSLVRIARFGKPARLAQQNTTSTSFRARVILPDPRIEAARRAFHKAVTKRIADLEILISESVNEQEADHWRSLLRNLE